jgi:hypothetical protein
MGYTEYIVKAGDNLSKIARRFGLKSWQEVYNDPNNATFRMSRPNPNLIHPNDIVRISDRCCSLAKHNECPYTGLRSNYTCPSGYVKNSWPCTEGTRTIVCGECSKAPSGGCFDADDWHCSIWWWN